MGILTRTLPRLAPRVIRRPRLERRLANDAGLPVRLIVAPPGTGKTTLVLQRLSEVPLAAYCSVPAHASELSLITAICEALGLAPVNSYVEMLVALRAAAVEPLELAIDDIDRAAPEARALLSKLIQNLPQHVSLIYCMRSREAVDVNQWVARGIASFIDATRLAFDAPDVTALCDSSHVPYSNADIARLIDETDGWAVVVGGAIRAAAEDERSLSDAYERWRARYGEVFLDFVLGEAQDAAPQDLARLQTLMRGGLLDDRNALHHLEAKGLFAFNDGGKVRSFKALQHVRDVPIADVETSIPLVVRMLGRFSVSIHSREVEWIRRRDQQIVKYLLVHQGASATRSELTETFWPRVEKQLASQSLRTACSNIRKAIASVVGYGRVERYFRAATTISLDLSSVVTDVGRFTAHVTAGDAAYDAGAFDEAAMHYQSAEKVYGGRLYDEDAVEPWFAQHAQTLEDKLGIVLERLAQHAYSKGDLKHAAEFAYRAKLIRPEQQGVLRLLSRLDGRQYSA